MSKTIWKDVLWLGRWETPDGRSLTVKPADLNAVVANGRKMLANRLGIPWCWDHQADAHPVEMSSTVYVDPSRRADAARNVITLRTVGFEVRRTDRGPAVFAGFDAADLSEEELQRIRRAGKVSCRIDRNFWDARGHGSQYPGLSISHIAVTPKPLEPDQGPFLMSAVQCADESFYLGYAMAKDDAENENENDGTPEQLSMDDDTIEPSELEMPDEPEEPADVPPMDTPVEPPVEPPAMDTFAQPTPDPMVASIVGSLAALGIPLPADGTIIDLGGLATALKIAVAMKGSNPVGGDELKYEPPTEQGAAPPMLMSQAAMAEKYPDRVQNDRRNLKAKINNMFRAGKIDRPTRDRMLREFETFEMSYSGSRIRVRGLLAAVQEMDRLIPRGTFLARGKAFNMSQTAIVNPPEQFSKSAKDQQEAADLEEITRMVEQRNKARGIK